MYAGMLNLDTHIVIFALRGDLLPRERDLLEQEPWSISAIVLWELSKLAALGRIDLDLDDPETVRALSAFHIWHLDLAVARASAHLDFRSDPADELIAATSLVHDVPLLTRDHTIRGSKIVPLA